MQNRGVIPLFISASRLGPNLCLYYPEGFKANFHLLAPGLRSLPRLLSSGCPPPRSSVPVWADLHRATMHVAGAVASQRWDRPAHKRSLLRQHTALEECGLRGGRSSTCVVVAARASPRRPKQQMYRNLDLFFFFLPPHSNEQTGARDAQMSFKRGLWHQGSPAELVYLFLTRQQWPFLVVEANRQTNTKN